MNAASRSSAPAVSSVPNPSPLATAPTASERTETTTNFDSTSDASVSTSLRHQCETDGQTKLASARGRNSTAT